VSPSLPLSVGQDPGHVCYVGRDQQHGANVRFVGLGYVRLEQHVVLHQFLAVLLSELRHRLDLLHQVLDERQRVVVDRIQCPPGRGHLLRLLDAARYLVRQAVFLEHLHELPLRSGLVVVGLVRPEL
ncbi:MAG: hypothetical protein ACK55Z_31230, partial [bacterium]